MGAPRAARRRAGAHGSERPRGRGRRHRRHGAHPSRPPARAHAVHAVPAARHRRPGRRCADAGPRLRARPRRRAGHRVALDRQRARGRGRHAVRCRAGGGGAAPSSGVGAHLRRTIIGRDGRSPQPRALPRAHRARGLRLRPVQHRQGRARARRRLVVVEHARAVLAGHREEVGRRQEEGREAQAQDLRRQGGRHALRHRGEDGRVAGYAAEAQPQPQSAGAAGRPAAQAEPVRVAGAALLVALLIPGAARAATPPPCPASVGAPSAIVVEVSTGTVACARFPDRRRPVGSTTKLMTALLTLERAKLSDTFTASRYRASSVESRIGLLPGERMKVADLMRGLLAESGNDAAAALAEGVSGSQRAFVRAMNVRARRLGLNNTHYENPIGLDDAENYSSARDLVTLATVLRTNAFFKKVVDSPQVMLKSGAHPRTFTNRNLLVRRYPYVNGVKTGHTNGAGYVLVGSASRHGIQLVSAVLDEPSEPARDVDTIALYDWAYKRFQRIRAVVKGRVLATVPIRDRAGAELPLRAGRTVRRIVLRGHRRDFKLATYVPDSVAGPIRPGQHLGRVEVRQAGRLVGTVPLVAANRVPAAGIAQKTKTWAARPLVLVLAGAAVFAVVLLARRRLGARPSREARAA